MSHVRSLPRQGTAPPPRFCLVALVKRSFEDSMDELERRVGPGAHLLRHHHAAILAAVLATGAAGLLGVAVYLAQAIAGCPTVLPLVPAILFLTMLGWLGCRSRPRP